jgi:hypothetical protein
MTPLHHRLASALTFACSAGVGLAACGGDTSSPLGPGDVVWSTSVRSLVVLNEGGGLLPPPPKSECMPGAGEYTLSIESSTLTSWRCEGVGNTPLKRVNRSRAINHAAMELLLPTLEQLQIVDSRACGADKPAITLRVTDANGTVEYRDSFYGCVMDPRPMIDTNVLGDLFGKLDALVTAG